MTEQTAHEQQLAQTLFAAATNHEPLQAADFDQAQLLPDDESAYRVQDTLTALKQEAVGGYKISLTSPETQALFQADSPLYGAQVASHVLAAPHTFAASDLLEPLAEVELLFTVQEQLSVDDSPAELLAKTLVAPAIEVPDSRFSAWFPALAKRLVLADAAVGGYIVYGREQPANAVFSSPDEVAQVTCQLFHNGTHLKDGQATEVLGNPLTSLHWLVEKLASQGKSLAVGQRVSSGTFLLPEPLTTGEWRAEFNSGLGEVSLNVTD